jgi:hypothetical protein
VVLVLSNMHPCSHNHNSYFGAVKVLGNFDFRLCRSHSSEAIIQVRKESNGKG